MKVDKNDPDTQPEGGLARNLTRRTWLQHVGWITAAAAFPQLTRAAANDISPVMEKLSLFMAEARNRALPENVVQETKHHILDTFAAMISGSELPPGRMAVQFARSYGGKQIATVVASDIMCGPIEAAFANGELAHSDETDDDFTTGGAHPGCAVVPAALAMGEQFSVSGTHSAGVALDLISLLMKTVGEDEKPQPGLNRGATAGGMRREPQCTTDAMAA